MNKVMSQMFSCIAISALCAQVALAQQSDDGNNIPIFNTFCGMEIGEGTENQTYVLENDVICTPQALANLGKNAAVTIVGENTTLQLNGHNIIMNGAAPLNNRSTDDTAALNSIGIYLPVYASKVIGSLDGQSYGNIVGFSVGVEVGMAGETLRPAGGFNIVRHVQVLGCTTAFRILNSNNLIEKTKAACGPGLLPPPPPPCSAEDCPSPLTPTRVGYQIGINALDAEHAWDDCRDAAAYPAVSHNILRGNIAQNNINGIIGANEMNDFGHEQRPNNRIILSETRFNSSDGITLLGSGYVVAANYSHHNGAIGINVSRLNPECGPSKGVVNKVILNRARFNVLGIAATKTILADGYGDNGGTVFERNKAKFNEKLNLFDQNGYCAFWIGDLDDANLWLGNTGRPAFPLCTLRPFRR